MSKPSLRAWVRSFLWLDGVVQRAVNLQDSLRDELFLAWIPPGERTAITTSLYSREPSYMPGRGHVERGLFPAEEYALRARPLAPGARILLGAAGTGRELVTLVQRGFDVVAFDPCSSFADAARSIAPQSKFVDASYADVIQAARSGTGPLAFVRDEPAFDAIMFGWGSLSHVLPHAERVSLFSALRTLAPRAPIFASFLFRPDTADFTRGRARNAFKRIFTTLGAPGTSEKGDHFSPYIGFFSALGREEIDMLAAESGYDVVHFDAGADAYAVFEPKKIGT
ncbi:MAG: hypothetical protein IPM54_23740 [Polyangiaceae bacterium]|nr:hypothetical protein [Polyangiaceae bacterium]